MKCFGILTMVLVLFNSCKHDNFNDFVGPAHCPPSTFKILQNLQASNDTVNFLNENLTLSARFSEPISWTVTIKGTVSNAVKTYSGKSDTISIEWKGNPGSSVFFKEETVTAELSVACFPKDVQTVYIDQPNNFINYGVLVSDFDGLGEGGTWSFYPAYTEGGQWLAAPAVVNAPSDPSPQGGAYYFLNGKASSESWFIGGAFHFNSLLNKLGTTNPEEVYFNAFVNFNSVNSTSLAITILQKTGGKKTLVIAKDHWSGWKLVSFKLSDVGVVNPNNVTGVDFGIGPTPEQGLPASVKYDFIIFTKGEPFYKE